MTSETPLKEAANRLLDVVDNSLHFLGHVRGHLETLASDVQRDSAEVAKESRDLVNAAASKMLLAKRGIRATPKALRIAAHLLALVARYRVEAGRSESRTDDDGQRLQALHESCAKSLRRLCEEQRGALLKLAQFLSMRPDLLPDAYIKELSTLQDQVPPLPLEELETLAEDQLGQPLQDLFASVEEEAVAAASLAQVHRAIGHDGKTYAVKIQIPDALDEAMSDIAILQAIAATVPPESVPFDVRTTLEELARSVEEELDYHAEAESMQAIREQLQSMPGVQIPAPVADLSGKRILTMEWTDGAPLNQALAGASPERKRDILTRLVRCFVVQIFENGHAHADPHAGNILIRTDEASPQGFELVLLDFGCTAEFSDSVRQSYVALLMALFTRREDAVIEELIALGFEQDGDDARGLARIAEAMLAPLQREGALAEWASDPRAGAKALMEVTQSVPGLKSPRHFVLLGRILATLGGILIAHADAEVSLPALLAGELARIQSSTR